MCVPLFVSVSHTLTGCSGEYFDSSMQEFADVRRRRACRADGHADVGIVRGFDIPAGVRFQEHGRDIIKKGIFTCLSVKMPFDCLLPPFGLDFRKMDGACRVIAPGH